VSNIVTDNKKRIYAGNAVFLAAIFLLTFGCWNEYAWYEFTAPLGTVISFAALLVTTLLYVDLKALIKDRAAWFVAAGCIVAFVNILIVKSGIGAFFTVADMLLILYLADKIRMGKKTLLYSAIYIGFFFYYWTFDVKGYFKGYNTNYGGLVLITGFVFAIVLIVHFRNLLRKRNNKLPYYLLTAFFIFMFAWGYNIISWYRARCALLGLVILIFLLLIPQKIFANKVVYRIFVYGVTFGAIAISGVYILLGKIKDVFTIQIFYKDILSGRDEIWSELWSEFLKKPLTGIGSSYTMKLEWMGGMFEVHNGLLDILIVHGVVVFAIVAAMIIRILLMMREKVEKDNVARAAVAGIMAIMGASFMENFFIVPPFSLCFLMLIVIVFNDFKKECN